MDRELEIKTKLRFQDALRYNLYVAYNTTINRIFLILSIISLGMFIYNMINADSSIDQRFAQSFALLIPPFIFCVMIPMKVWKATGALIDSQILKDKVIYIFRKESITLRTSQGEADIPWNSYVRIAETRHDFRLFMDKVQAQIIPKYSLEQQQIQELRIIINEAADSQVIKLKMV